MSNKERLPKLVSVYDPKTTLKKRQLPLLVDENLTLVMDLTNSGIVCDNPGVRGRELEEFTRKYELLTESEVKSALQITKLELMNVLNHSVPCVGCRRSVERLYHQLHRLRHPTLQPLMVEKDGTITIQGNIKKPPKGDSQKPHEGDSQESPEGDSQEPYEGDSQEPPEGDNQEPHEGDSQESPRGDSQESHVGDCQVSLEGDSQESPERDSQESPEGDSQEPPEEVIREPPEPKVLCAIFRNHTLHLDKLIENQPKRSKKSQRCLLHSLDSQRSRPLTPIWKDVWNCLLAKCKKEVCIIESQALHTTLDTYLRKHRFCGDCKTKVLKAYSLLMEDNEPQKEKGYVPSLYANIKRCIPEKHIHLSHQHNYITKLINRAEPELFGSRRERHAKTLEIAQEEVLTCLGICMYERLHRIYMRIREEECTCQVFAAVAVDTLSRSFETAVERKQGRSQLELLYEEFSREERKEQIRKEQKKIKRKRKKGKTMEQEGKENCGCIDEDEDEKDETTCSCTQNKNDLNCYDVDVDGGDGVGDDSCCKIKWMKECKCQEEIEENNKKNSILYFNKKDNDNGLLSARSHSRDCGYLENNNRCCETGSVISSASSSSEGSELACSDGYQQDIDIWANGRFGHYQSLQEMVEMLEVQDCDDEDDSKLTPEEVREFENNHQHLFQKRQELRAVLRKKFLDFCHCYSHSQVPRILLQTKYASN